MQALRCSRSKSRPSVDRALKLIVTYDPMFVYATEYVNTGMTPSVQGYTDRSDGEVKIVNAEVNVWKKA